MRDGDGSGLRDRPCPPDYQGLVGINGQPRLRMISRHSSTGGSVRARVTTCLSKMVRMDGPCL